MCVESVALMVWGASTRGSGPLLHTTGARTRWIVSTVAGALASLATDNDPSRFAVA